MFDKVLYTSLKVRAKLKLKAKKKKKKENVGDFVYRPIRLINNHWATKSGTVSNY